MSDTKIKMYIYIYIYIVCTKMSDTKNLSDIGECNKSGSKHHISHETVH